MESINPVPGNAGVYAVRVRVSAWASAGESVPVTLQVIGVDGKLFRSTSIPVTIEQGN